MMIRSLMSPFQASGPAAEVPAPEMVSSFLLAAEAVSTIILTIIMLALLLTLLGMFLQVRRLTRTIGEVTGRVGNEAAPVLERARHVVENVEFITAAVRTDVEKLTDSVARLNQRLREASERMEERIQDFNALVDVIQSEAEDLALDTAAVVRGVQAGTRSLAGEEPAGLPGPTEALSAGPPDSGSED